MSGYRYGYIICFTIIVFLEYLWDFRRSWLYPTSSAFIVYCLLMIGDKKQMTKPQFSASFTAGSLFVNEFIALSDQLISENILEILRNEVKLNHVLSIKSEKARSRVVSEIKKRIKAVDGSFWHFFLECSDPEKYVSLFYVCMKTYALVFDLHFEVVVKRWRILEREISLYDLQMRFDELASQTDTNIGNWTESTRKELIQTYLRMLREAKLLHQTTLIKPNIPNPDFWKYFIHQGDAWFLDACFLTKLDKEALL